MIDSAATAGACSSRLFQSGDQCSDRQGPWEPGILCGSGARTSALQTPVVTYLGAGEDLRRFSALTARSGQSTRRLRRGCSHTGERPSRGLPSSRFPAGAPTQRTHSRKPRSMARPAQRTMLWSARRPRSAGGGGVYLLSPFFYLPGWVGVPVLLTLHSSPSWVGGVFRFPFAIFSGGRGPPSLRHSVTSSLRHWPGASRGVEPDPARGVVGHGEHPYGDGS